MFFCVTLSRNLLFSFMDRYSFLNAANTQFFADLYDRYTQNPDSVEPSWRAFFQGFDFAQENYLAEDFETNHFQNSFKAEENSQIKIPSQVETELKTLNLIKAYRTYGHLHAQNNPIKKAQSRGIKIEDFGLYEKDLQTKLKAGEEIGLKNASLKEIITELENIFLKSIGVEYEHSDNPEIKNWISSYLKTYKNKPQFSAEEKLSILEKLNQASSFENFLHTKYVGQKRFSLEGGDSLIPALYTLVKKASQKGVKEVVIGMAHRGRLNVLANILNKNPQEIFLEFDGKDYEIDLFDGDVKYHLGHTSVSKFGNDEILLNLCPNPSHLEAAGPVIEGICRAKQDKRYPEDFSKVLPIKIHGDAAISGQGIVYETIQMSELQGYKTGGTIHIVINNQVGFTTNYTDSRSTTYCTDIAKVTQSPVLHINADDTEAVVYGVLFALEFRQRFGKDVYLDLIGYRKYGHNEGDEPRFTQPIMYKTLSTHRNPTEIYAEKLKQEGILKEGFLESLDQKYRQKLDDDLQESRKSDLTILSAFMQNEWEGFKGNASKEKMLQKVDTTFPKEKLNALCQSLATLDEDKKFISKVVKVISGRKEAYKNNAIDWGLAEHLAFASLLSEGYDIRISGEDVGRGTFSHRHSVIKVEDSEEEIIPLKKIAQQHHSHFYSYNSHLSEYGVLGFDYGYALASPNTLTIWEAQFGDFANGAQIMIDQYICCTEDKWKNQNGLVMLLPHGYEGQGAEHSSGRVERFLQLCATQNMFIANCTTPANLFHLLRRQMKADYRKPLVIFTPKGLLRHPQVISKVEDLTQGSFQEVLDDAKAVAENIKTLVLCSGRFYYDLIAEREKLGREDVAVIRLEQLFPLPEKQLEALISKYKNATDFVWAQEEPKNMGAYGYMLMNFNLKPLRLASMGAFSAPASGSHTRDRKRHKEAIDKVFNP